MINKSCNQQQALLYCRSIHNPKNFEQVMEKNFEKLNQVIQLIFLFKVILIFNT